MPFAQCCAVAFETKGTEDVFGGFVVSIAEAFIRGSRVENHVVHVDGDTFDPGVAV